MFFGKGENNLNSGSISITRQLWVLDNKITDLFGLFYNIVLIEVKQLIGLTLQTLNQKLKPA